MQAAIKLSFSISLLGTLLSGCSTAEKTIEIRSSSSTVVLRETVNELEKDPVPGTINEVWVEPMYDTVRVPGQLDPAGNYYRMPHSAVVEIRPGKYQKVEYPREDGSYEAGASAPQK